MTDDKDQGLGQGKTQDQQLHREDNQSSFPYEETTTRITKSNDNETGDTPKDFPKETKSSEE